MYKHTWRLLAAASLTFPLVTACGTRNDNGTTGDSAGGTMAMTDSTGMSTQGSVNDMSAGTTDASLASFVALVSESEVEAGQLASTKARNSDVKAFAKNMVDEHTKAMQEIRDLGTRSGWAMPAPGSGGATMGSGNDSAARQGTGSGTTGGSTSGMANRANGGSAAGTTGGTTGGATDGNAMTSTSGAGGMMESTITQMQQAHQTAMQSLRASSGAMFDRTYMEAQVAAHQQALDVLRQHSSSVQNSDLRTKISDMQKDIEEHLRRAQEIAQKLGTTS